MKRVLFAALSLALLSACAGGGSTMNPPPLDANAPSPTGNTMQEQQQALADAGAVSVLDQLHSSTTIGSTIDPTNGDQNPYGLDIARITSGKLTAGDLVVSNFNDAANVQGTGTSIIALHPTPGSKPRHIIASSLLHGPTELTIDPEDNIFNAVFVARKVPVYNSNGAFAAALNGPWDKPFGIAYANRGGILGQRAFYESNAGSSGTIVRINRASNGASFSFQTIARGFPVNGGVPGTELGPSGLQYDNTRDRLYIVDGTNNAVYYFEHASTIPANAIVVNPGGMTFSGPFASRAHVLFSGAPVSGPISSALLFNGNLVVGNTGDPTGVNNMVEISPAGKLLAVKNVDNGASGAIFGMVASGTSVATTKLYFNDDNANAVVRLSP